MKLEITLLGIVGMFLAVACNSDDGTTAEKKTVTYTGTFDNKNIQYGENGNGEVKFFVAPYEKWNVGGVKWNSAELRPRAVKVINSQAEYKSAFGVTQDADVDFASKSLVFTYGYTVTDVDKVSYTYTTASAGEASLSVDVELYVAEHQAPDVWYVGLEVPKLSSSAIDSIDNEVIDNVPPLEPSQGLESIDGQWQLCEDSVIVVSGDATKEFKSGIYYWRNEYVVYDFTPEGKLTVTGNTEEISILPAGEYEYKYAKLEADGKPNLQIDAYEALNCYAKTDYLTITGRYRTEDGNLLIWIKLLKKMDEQE
jgi:hypothetical protein